MTPDALDPAKLAELKADAENPLIAPSRRVAARLVLRKIRETEDKADRRQLLAVITRTLNAA
ncbi:hypothetical protein [Acidiphilium acidophilum]|uniref:hypothetical protein n=1 Tax=Acidiphilium acidophilum TaxID=76588 RepID=UPI002E8E6B29|nr:hypothetical protein [Acidiphilium acidophilum]